MRSNILVIKKETASARAVGSRVRHPAHSAGRTVFSAANYAAAAQGPVVGRNGGPTAAALVVVTVDDHPIVRGAQFVSPCGVGVQGRVMAAFALVCRTGSQASPVGLKRRGATRGSLPCLAN